MSGPYPFLKVSGSPAEMGYQIGAALRRQIRRFIQIIVANLPLEEAKVRARFFLPAFERHCPRLLEEIEGLAKGAEISLEEALLPNVRAAVHLVDGCTAFVVAGRATAAGRVLIGQNQDMSPAMQEVGVVVEFCPASGQRILMWTFAGLIAYHGINEAGLGIFCNSLPEPSRRGPLRRDRVLPGYAIKRLMLEQDSIGGVLDLLDSVKSCTSPFGQANYVLCDRKGIADVELYEGGFSMLPEEAGGYILHTNHYICEELRDLNQHTLPTQIRDAHEADSMPRLAQVRELFRGMSGSISVEGIQQALSDHLNHPRSICRHSSGPGSAVTVASIIAEPADGRMQVCRGNPCGGTYHTYGLA